ncbi:SRPBCC family protein [Nocardia sp. XZ_19_385]|uniref:type II toxin-antitoxin system Rv0910 family toxin n=1 Tax=Nocardia sp. XZ_19_385 TaxID=2769488 RepID=UPI00188FA1AB|nr:SRPBCC family protein [Nocardia sp. XZ_19_385]
MALASASKEIAASQDKVWAIIADPSRNAEWNTLHDKWKSEAPTVIAQGDKMSEVVSIMGMPNTIVWEVTQYDAPNTFTISGAGMANAKVTFTMSVEANGAGSIAKIDAEFISQMMVGAIGKAIERTAFKELEASLLKLADLVA